MKLMRDLEDQAAMQISTAVRKKNFKRSLMTLMGIRNSVLKDAINE